MAPSETIFSSSHPINTNAGANAANRDQYPNARDSNAHINMAQSFAASSSSSFSPISFSSLASVSSGSNFASPSHRGPYNYQTQQPAHQPPHISHGQTAYVDHSALPANPNVNLTNNSEYYDEDDIQAEYEDELPSASSDSVSGSGSSLASPSSPYASSSSPPYSITASSPVLMTAYPRAEGPPAQTPTLRTQTYAPAAHYDVWQFMGPGMPTASASTSVNVSPVALSHPRSRYMY